MSIVVGRQVATLAMCTLLSTAASAQVAWLGERDQILATFEQQPLINVERQWLDCARETELRILSFDEATVCSMAHEAFLRRRFGGDFSALLAWWRTHRSRSGDMVVREHSAPTRP